MKIKYWNNQKWSECQLVSLWNAAKFYGVKVPVRYGKEYRKACKKACAISGGALHPEYVIKDLGLRAIEGKWKWAWVCKNLPVEFHVFCQKGYHSILAVGLRRKIIIIKKDPRKKFRVITKSYNEIALTNMTRNKLAWIPWTYLRTMRVIGSVNPTKWVKVKE